MGTHRAGSDIDLTLQGGPALTLAVVHRIVHELDDLMLPHTFDLSLFAALSKPELLEHIRRVGVVLYEREPVRGGELEPAPGGATDEGSMRP